MYQVKPHKTSIIDLIFTPNNSSILLNGAGDPFLGQNVRYRCLVYFVLSYHKAPTSISTRHIWLYDRGKYQSYACNLHETNRELLKDNDIAAYAKNIIDRAKQHIPNKTIKTRQIEDSKVGCAVISDNHSNMQRIPDDSSIFTAEAKAVDLAIDFISTCDANNKFIIFSDSISVLRAMNHTSSKNPQIQKLLEKCHELKLSSVGFLVI